MGPKEKEAKTDTEYVFTLKHEGAENTFMKSNLENVLFRRDYCCICYETGSVSKLSSPNSCGGMTKIAQLIRIFGQKIKDDLSNDLICDQCSEELESVDNFFDKVENYNKIMHYFFRELDSKVNDIILNVQESSSTELENTVIILNFPHEIITSNNVRKEMLYEGYSSDESFTYNSICNKKKDSKFLSYLCDACGLGFSSLEEQKDHQIEQHGTCENCTKKFADPVDLERHKEKCNRIYRKTTLECSDCGKIFLTKRSFSDHYYKEHVSDADKKKSLNAETSKFTKAGFQAGKKNRRCYLCPAAFVKNSDLKEHLKSNHSPDEKYYCELCSGVYNTRIAFIRHIYSYGHLRKVDPSLKLPFKCNECDMSFGSHVELESHTNFKHLNKKPYKCNKCGKQFAAQAHLDRHVKRHDRGQRYECSYCFKRFTEKTGLKAHTMRFHKKQSMPAACEVCGKTFVCLYQCKLHQQRTHSAKTFPCPVCASMYHALSNVRSHVKKVHLKNLTLKEFMNEKGYIKELDELFMDRRTLSKEQKLQIDQCTDEQTDGKHEDPDLLGLPI